MDSRKRRKTSVEAEIWSASGRVLVAEVRDMGVVETGGGWQLM